MLYSYVTCPTLFKMYMLQVKKKKKENKTDYGTWGTYLQGRASVSLLLFFLATPLPSEKIQSGSTSVLANHLTVV